VTSSALACVPSTIHLNVQSHAHTPVSPALALVPSFALARALVHMLFLVRCLARAHALFLSFFVCLSLSVVICVSLSFCRYLCVSLSVVICVCLSHLSPSRAHASVRSLSFSPSPPPHSLPLLLSFARIHVSAGRHLLSAGGASMCRTVSARLCTAQ